MKFLLSALFLIWLVSLPCSGDFSQIEKAAEPKRFRIFDGLLYSNKPDFSVYGILPAKIIYHRDLWGEGQDDSNLPDPIRLKRALKFVGINNYYVTVIDIEHWGVIQSNGQFSQENLDKHLKVITELRKLSPNMPLGYYGIPIMDYWRAINGHGKLEAPQWQAENDKLMPIVDAQDAVFPVLYTFYADRDGWRKFAIAQITEAKRLAKGKPVYAFLWPQYFGGNPILGYNYIQPDYWKLELETVKKYADGIILWGGNEQIWDANASWWQVTKEFLKTN